MELRIRTKKKKTKELKLSAIWEHVSDWWEKSYHWIFILMMIIAMCLGIYYWYLSLYKPIMNDQERNNFRTTKDRSVKFMEDDFNGVISNIEKRAQEYLVQPETKKDIFK